MKKVCGAALLAALLLFSACALADGLTADALREGEYAITVDSSASMFRVVACTLTVKDGTMAARMTMSGTGYGFVYPGTAEEAAAADPAGWIPYEEDADGAFTFTFPIDALDADVLCAAYSRKRETWYDRTMVFRSDALPASAFVEGAAEPIPAISLADGVYQAEIELVNAAGRQAKVKSPAALTVVDGRCFVEIEWNNANAASMSAEGETFPQTLREGKAVFTLPVPALDQPIAVSAEVTALGKPQTVAYTLTVKSL